MADYGYDPIAVAFYDVAHEGAQLRAVAGAIQDHAFAPLLGLRPRSIIVLHRESVAHAAMNVVLSMRSPLAVPVVAAKRLPTFAGPLDVVIVLSDRDSDPLLEQDLYTARDRGCAIVFAGMSRSELSRQCPAEAIRIPSLPNAEGNSALRAVGVMLAVLDAVTAKNYDAGLSADVFMTYSQEVDEEITACSPDRDLVLNQARQLAELPGPILHLGDTDLAAAIAGLAAVYWTTCGNLSTTATMDEYGVLAQRVKSSDMFHDPFLDGPAPQTYSTVLWALEEQALVSSVVSQQRVQSLDRAAAPFRLIARAQLATAFMS